MVGARLKMVLRWWLGGARRFDGWLGLYEALIWWLFLQGCIGAAMICVISNRSSRAQEVSTTDLVLFMFQGDGFEMAGAR